MRKFSTKPMPGFHLSLILVTTKLGPMNFKGH